MNLFLQEYVKNASKSSALKMSAELLNTNLKCRGLCFANAEGRMQNAELRYKSQRDLLF